jgi:glycopeptide antibiotics resistance protein
VALAVLAVGPLPLDPDAIAAAREAARLDHNGVPFATLERQLASGPDRDAMVQLVGNLLLLAPLGVYGPALWRSLRSPLAIVLVAGAVSAVVELGQLGLSELYGFPIRIADVDDVILNTAGALLGWVAWWVATSGGAADAGRVASASR